MEEDRRESEKNERVKGGNEGEERKVQLEQKKDGERNGGRGLKERKSNNKSRKRKELE